MARPRMIAINRLKQLERRGYTRFTPTFWHEVVIGGEKRLTPYLLGEIRKFERVALTPLPIQKIGGVYFFDEDAQIGALRGYEDAMRQLKKARGSGVDGKEAQA